MTTEPTELSINIWEKCKNCNIRIGAHTIPHSVGCRIINKDQLNDIPLKHTDIWEMLHNKLISKEKAITLFHNLTNDSDC